ncbi:MAG: 16S rRNA (cytosine(1402)-N(4))-methyltransferase, partial [Candidatus Levybacteria bacterium CG10_big_fil_rev_8_21_14_0_10_36_7]
GKLAVITFHSTEDRLVKRTFKNFKEKGLVSFVNKKPIGPSREEIQSNKRSRSAKLRVIEKQ